jgi:surface antigen
MPGANAPRSLRKGRSVVEQHVLSTRRSIRPTRKGPGLRQSATSVLVIAAVAALVAPMALPAFAFEPEVAAPAASAELEPVTVEVSDGASRALAARDAFSATTVADLNSARAATAAAAARAARAAAGSASSGPATYRASSVAAAGDDYPWRTGPTSGLSPLRYVYRQCVDFVVWRLNRDVGSVTAPFAYTWGYLTPNGGNARDFKAAWLAHGWPTSNSPVAGDIAWWGNNHVAYVKAVNADGTVALEEYNAVPFTYSERTIPASKVDLFLSPPPR